MKIFRQMTLQILRDIRMLLSLKSEAFHSSEFWAIRASYYAKAEKRSLLLPSGANWLSDGAIQVFTLAAWRLALLVVATVVKFNRKAMAEWIRHITDELTIGTPADKTLAIDSAFTLWCMEKENAGLFRCAEEVEQARMIWMAGALCGRRRRLLEEHYALTGEAFKDPHTTPCPSCDGTGIDKDPHQPWCRSCGGIGEVYVPPQANELPEPEPF